VLAGVLWLPVLVAAAPPTVNGTLETIEGVRVLKLWGSPFEQGFAHGYLLGEDALPLMQAVLGELKLLGNPAVYEALHQRVAQQFLFEPDRLAELEGMLAGVRAVRGARGTRLEVLGRDLDVQDLQVLNAVADLNQMMCSSFSVWGDLGPEGETLTARNLDFPLHSLANQHVLIVYLEPGKERRRWVSLAWPGLIGAYTAMNEDGVTISIHDAPGLPPEGPGPFVPRSFVLREALERASADHAFEVVQRVLEERPVRGGNNVHASVPYRGQDAVAAVLEYDGQRGQAKGVSVRRPGVATDLVPPTALVCTNHYRLRGPARSCGRYEFLSAALTEAAARQEHITVDRARTLLAGVAMRGGVLTLQSVVFLPNRGEIHVGLATVGEPAPGPALARLSLQDLWRR